MKPLIHGQIDLIKLAALNSYNRELFESGIKFRCFNKMPTFKYKSGAQKRKEKRKEMKPFQNRQKFLSFLYQKKEVAAILEI